MIPYEINKIRPKRIIVQFLNKKGKWQQSGDYLAEEPFEPGIVYGILEETANVHSGIARVLTSQGNQLLTYGRGWVNFVAHFNSANLMTVIQQGPDKDETVRLFSGNNCRFPGWQKFVSSIVQANGGIRKIIFRERDSADNYLTVADIFFNNNKHYSAAFYD